MGNRRCHEHVDTVPAEGATPSGLATADSGHGHPPGEVAVLFLVVALLLLGIVVGAAAYLPWPVALVLGCFIAGWLVVFAGRERRRRNRTRRA